MAWRLNSLAILSLLSSASQGTSGPIGPTFPIAEPDTLTEIQDRAAKVDWEAVRTRMVQKSSALRSAKLPLAQHDGERIVDPTYTLPRDITGGDGKVLFAAGTKVNVYKRIKDPGRTIVIADVPAHYHWLQEVAKPTARDRVLLANGNVLEARERTGLMLYLLDARFIERFGLQSVPSIVQQDGTVLRVREYAVR